MAVSATDKELLKYVAQLDEVQKQSLLQLVKSFLKGSPEPETPISLAQYNQELEEAMQRVNRGEYTTLEDLEKEMQAW